MTRQTVARMYSWLMILTRKSMCDTKLTAKYEYLPLLRGIGLPMCVQYKSVVKPLKVEYRTAKHDWMALKSESGSFQRVGSTSMSNAGGGFPGAHNSGDKVEVRNAELQWRAVSPKLFKAAKDLLEDFSPKVRAREHCVLTPYFMDTRVLLASAFSLQRRAFHTSRQIAQLTTNSMARSLGFPHSCAHLFLPFSLIHT